MALRPYGRNGHLPTTFIDVKKILLTFLIITTACSSGNIVEPLIENVLNQSFETENGFETLEGIYEENNQPMVVNLWATWCTPCLKEIPALVEFYNENSDYVEILGLDYEPVNLPIIDEFIERFSINYPLVLYNENNDSEFSNFGEIVGMPTTQIYSPEGELLQTFMGEITIDDLNKYISPLS